MVKKTKQLNKFKMADKQNLEIPPYPDKINDTIYDVFRSYVDPLREQFQLTSASIEKVWRNLSIDERDTLRKTLERNRSQDVRKYVNYLSSLEPYLQLDQRNQSSLRKQQAVLDESVNTIEESKDLEEPELQELDELTQNDAELRKQQAVLDESVNTIEESKDLEEPELQELDVSTRNDADSVPETTVRCPVPPPIDARDLYLRTHEAQMGREQCLAEWKQLPPVCKRRYGKATHILKQQYLMEYENYLHSLQSRDLYALYKQRVRF